MRHSPGPHDGPGRPGHGRAASVTIAIADWPATFVYRPARGWTRGFGQTTRVPALLYGVIMTLPRRARVTLGAGIAVLLAGILGLALWWWWRWRRRPGGEPVARLRRVQAGVVAAGLVIVAVGAVWRTAVAIEHTPACAPPGGAQAATRSGPFEVSLLAQQAATWPETGMGLLYSRASDARICLSRAADYYVAVHARNPTGARALNLGDILLTPGFNVSRQQLRTLIGHEA